MDKPRIEKQIEKRTLDPKHAAWLVENRAATQRTSAKLYGLLRKHPQKLNDLALETQHLVAVSFSLWRSAFLSDKTGFREDTQAGSINFLSEMLQNNAIAYSQERSAKDWTFNYYADNARYRLRELKERWPGFQRRLTPPKGKQTPKNRWSYLQTAFDVAVNHFASLLKKGADRGVSP